MAIDARDPRGGRRLGPGLPAGRNPSGLPDVQRRRVRHEGGTTVIGFKIRIDRRVPGAKGTIRTSNPFDRTPRNDKAVISLAASPALHHSTAIWTAVSAAGIAVIVTLAIVLRRQNPPRPRTRPRRPAHLRTARCLQQHDPIPAPLPRQPRPQSLPMRHRARDQAQLAAETRRFFHPRQRQPHIARGYFGGPTCALRPRTEPFESRINRTSAASERLPAATEGNVPDAPRRASP
ncbi:hypothetical protein OK074_2818 [Actinobacteria bacterium OK074]|nr:hypothetical protein OK074_2818 [Actinobacteria bacterium OK074]